MPITPDTIDKETKDYLMRIYKAMRFRITPIEFLQLYCYAYNELERMGDPDPKTNAIQLMDSLDPSLSYSELKAELEGKLILREYPAVSEEMEELEELRKRVKELEEELAKARRYEYIDELMSIKRQLEKIRSEIKKLRQVPPITIDVRAIERRIQEEIKKLRDEILTLIEGIKAAPPTPPAPVIATFTTTPLIEYYAEDLVSDDLDLLRDKLDALLREKKIPEGTYWDLFNILEQTKRIFDEVSLLSMRIADMRRRVELRDKMLSLYKAWLDAVNLMLENYINNLLRSGVINREEAEALKVHYIRGYFDRIVKMRNLTKEEANKLLEKYKEIYRRVKARLSPSAIKTLEDYNTLNRLYSSLYSVVMRL